MRKIILALLILIKAYSAQSQVTPKVFESGIISNNGVFGFTLSPDSKTALWVSSNGKRDTLKIMESRKINGKWSTPVVAPFSTSNGEWKDIDPIFSPDGTTVLFQSNRNTGRSASRTDFDIWAVDFNNRSWGKPYNIGDLINTEASESYASMTIDKTIYFMKDNPDGIGKSDIYISEYKDGKYQTPQNIGFPINTNERESNPFISSNGDYIIYFSSDPKGFGDVDLMISTKKNGNWTTPKNLGKSINSSLAEFCPFVHKKEKKLYFSRQEKIESRMNENIYSVNFDVKKYQ